MLVRNAIRYRVDVYTRTKFPLCTRGQSAHRGDDTVVLVAEIDEELKWE